MTVETRLSQDKVQLLLEKMIGEYVWNVVILQDRILQVQFGEPHLRVVQVPKLNRDGDVSPRETRRVVSPSGRWTLFVEDGSWAVVADGFNCDRPTIDNTWEKRCLDALNGQKLTKVTLNDAEATLRMTFDLYGQLLVRFSVDFEQNTQWMLFCNGEGIIVCDANNEFLMEI